MSDRTEKAPAKFESPAFADPFSDDHKPSTFAVPPESAELPPAQPVQSLVAEAALGMRVQGFSMDEAARALSVPIEEAQAAIDDKVAKTREKLLSQVTPFDEADVIELARLDELLRVVWPKAIEGGPASGSAVDRVVMLGKRRDEVLGRVKPAVLDELEEDMADLSACSAEDLEALQRVLRVRAESRAARGGTPPSPIGTRRGRGSRPSRKGRKGGQTDG